jgi:hypothetical protein
MYRVNFFDIVCYVSPCKYSEIRGEIRFYIDLIVTSYALSCANKMAQLSIFFK